MITFEDLDRLLTEIAVKEETFAEWCTKNNVEVDGLQEAAKRAVLVVAMQEEAPSAVVSSMFILGWEAGKQYG